MEICPLHGQFHGKPRAVKMQHVFSERNFQVVHDHYGEKTTLFGLDYYYPTDLHSEDMEHPVLV